MAAVRWIDRSYPVLGGRIPAPIALLIAATFLMSIAGAQVPGLVAVGALFPDQVLAGQVWRLVTWVLFEQSPLGLIFAGLALFWFGGELVRIWGPGGFLLRYFGLAHHARCSL